MAVRLIKKFKDPVYRSEFMVNCLIYLRLIRLSVRVQTSNKLSLFFHALGGALISIVDFGGLAILFHRFKDVQGWNMYEIALFYGFVQISLTTADAITTGLDRMTTLILSGEFDRFFLRPQPILLQVIGKEITLRRFGRFVQAIFILFLGMGHLNLNMGFQSFGMLMVSFLSSTCFYFSVMIVQGATCFWTIETLEVFNILIYGSAQLGQYPISIFQNWLRNFFLFIIPAGGLWYFSILQLLGRSDSLHVSLFARVSIMSSGFIFLIASLFFWNFALRRYQSSGT